MLDKFDTENTREKNMTIPEKKKRRTEARKGLTGREEDQRKALLPSGHWSNLMMKLVWKKTKEGKIATQIKSQQRKIA